ncbi:DUF2634 domain-containing protein [Thermanaeromonas toyohensis]|uniref:DUF2634 domain-containing protein n=1 Tax=Thermanaeromonas toyohensis TaxID=161154 RepID=UPI001E30BCBE|nr:DUF2634 domain-containing protein [Thermanaeromonas toyohensis]
MSRDKTAVRFGRSFKFDFEAGEFVLTPNGKVTETQDVEAWLEWCSKALRTARYKYLVYSRNYGQEYEELIGKGLTRAAIESEIKRITEETLKVDPRTAGVKNFTFTWDNGAVYFTCEVSNVRGEIGQISGSVVIG